MCRNYASKKLDFISIISNLGQISKYPRELQKEIIDKKKIHYNKKYDCDDKGFSIFEIHKL